MKRSHTVVTNRIQKKPSQIPSSSTTYWKEGSKDSFLHHFKIPTTTKNTDNTTNIDTGTSRSIKDSDTRKTRGLVFLKSTTNTSPCKSTKPCNKRPSSGKNPRKSRPLLSPVNKEPNKEPLLVTIGGIFEKPENSEISTTAPLMKGNQYEEKNNVYLETSIKDEAPEYSIQTLTTTTSTLLKDSETLKDSANPLKDSTNPKDRDKSPNSLTTTCNLSSSLSSVFIDDDEEFISPLTSPSPFQQQSITPSILQTPPPSVATQRRRRHTIVPTSSSPFSSPPPYRKMASLLTPPTSAVMKTVSNFAAPIKTPPNSTSPSLTPPIKTPPTSATPLRRSSRVLTTPTLDFIQKEQLEQTPPTKKLSSQKMNNSPLSSSVYVPQRRKSSIQVPSAILNQRRLSIEALPTSSAAYKQRRASTVSTATTDEAKQMHYVNLKQFSCSEIDSRRPSLKCTSKRGQWFRSQNSIILTDEQGFFSILELSGMKSHWEVSVLMIHVYMCLMEDTVV